MIQIMLIEQKNQNITLIIEIILTIEIIQKLIMKLKKMGELNLNLEVQILKINLKNLLIIKNLEHHHLI